MNMDKKLLKSIRKDLKWFKSNGYHGLYDLHEKSLKKYTDDLHKSKMAYEKQVMRVPGNIRNVTINGKRFKV
jgi:hypothetical protein